MRRWRRKRYATLIHEVSLHDVKVHVWSVICISVTKIMGPIAFSDNTYAHWHVIHILTKFLHLPHNDRPYTILQQDSATALTRIISSNFFKFGESNHYINCSALQPLNYPELTHAFNPKACQISSTMAEKSWWMKKRTQVCHFCHISTSTAQDSPFQRMWTKLCHSNKASYLNQHSVFSSIWATSAQ